jgi:hypothetical protein
MKQIFVFLIAVALLPAAVGAQSLPDAPSPASPEKQTPELSPPTNPAWLRVQQMVNGQEVVVITTYGPPVRCRFAGATDAYLFCDPDGNPPGTDYRFDRVNVLNVRVAHLAPSGHPGIVLAVATVVGTVIGVAVARKSDAEGGAVVGALGFGLIGCATACFNNSPYNQFGGPRFAFPPPGVAHPHAFRTHARRYSVFDSAP